MALDWHRATRPEGTASRGSAPGCGGPCVSPLRPTWASQPPCGWWGVCSRRPAPRPALAGSAAARRGPSRGLLYLSAFASGDTRTGVLGVDPARAMEVGSASLATLASWAPVVAADPHAVASPLGFVPVVLVALAPLILGGQRGWRFPALVGGFALVASLGPTLRLAPGMAGAPGLLAPLTALPGAAWFRFPARLLWVTTLGFGLVASLAAGPWRSAWERGPSSFSRGRGGRGPGRGRRAVPHHPCPGTPPSARAALPDGPHLSLLAPSPGRHVDVELSWWIALCLAGLAPPAPLCPMPRHGHAVRPRARCRRRSMPPCWRTNPRSARLAAVGRGRFGVGSSRQLRRGGEAVLAGLETALGPATASSSDTGVQILVVTVPDPVTDRAQARDALAALP